MRHTIAMSALVLHCRFILLWILSSINIYTYLNI
jgi:hypothetical protein